MNKKCIITLIVIMVATIVATVISITPNKSNNLPDDFVQVKRDIEKGITYDLCTIDSEYYLQPEFYPSYQKFLNKKHDYSRWGVHGFGAYPGSISYKVENMKKGQTVSICTFIHTSFEVETFQGMKLTMNIPEQFDFSIESDNFLLYPAYPSTEKNKKWAYKTKMIFTAKEDIPTGNYDFKLKANAPKDDKATEYMIEMKKYSLETYKCPWFGECNEKIIELRKRVYVDAGQFTASEFFTFNLKVS